MKPSWRAAWLMLPPQSDKTRLMCSHSVRAKLGAIIGGGWIERGRFRALEGRE